MKTNVLNRASHLAWLVVGLLWVVALLNYTDRLLITSMRDAIKASLPMTEAQFGLLTSVFLWVYGAVSPHGGFLADRFSRRWVILGSLFVWSVFTWITGHAQSFGMLLFARAGMGISEACYIPAALALISDYHRGHTRSLATGLHMSGIYAGTAFGGIGGYLAEYFGWRAAFTLFGAVGVGYAFVLLRFLPDAPADAPVAQGQPAPPAIRFGAAIAGLAAQRAFWILLTLNVLVGVSNWLIYAWLPTYLREHFKLGIGAAGLSATAYLQAAAFVGVLVGGRWADRWAAVHPRGRMFVPAVGYFLAAPALFLMASTTLFAVAIGALLLVGLGKGFYDSNCMPILRQIADERYSATGYGILNCTSCLAGGVMTYAGGVLRDHQVDLAVVFQVTAVSLVGVGLMMLAMKPNPSLAAGTPRS